MDALFNSIVIADWSASSTPKRGKDSIWWALARVDEGVIATGNPTTRHEAIEILVHILASEADLGYRVLAGFDFPFGYPAGSARLFAGRSGWAAMWALLDENIKDTTDNSNNRFETAAAMNSRTSEQGPFWGCPAAVSDAHLSATKRGITYPVDGVSEWRVIERYQRGRPGANPKSVWQLMGNGSVGGQVLTGLPALERLRRDPRLAGRCEIWPFETKMTPGKAPVILAEVYPSLLDKAVAEKQRIDEVKDRAQVRINAQAFATLSAAQRLSELFSAAPDLDAEDRDRVVQEEAWILGAGYEDRLREAA